MATKTIIRAVSVTATVRELLNLCHLLNTMANTPYPVSFGVLLLANYRAIESAIAPLLPQFTADEREIRDHVRDLKASGKFATISQWREYNPSKAALYDNTEAAMDKARDKTVTIELPGIPMNVCPDLSLHQLDVFAMLLLAD